MKHHCPQCRFRARYDKDPNSFLGRLWRWHTGFCPGWRSYFNSLSEEEKQLLAEKYGMQDRLNNR